MANPNNIALQVTNSTGNALKVTGSRGTDLTNVQKGLVIPANSSAIVATFVAGNWTQDRWDWVYLQDQGTSAKYQIYIELTAVTRRWYASFGYFNADSSESNSNPSPFPGSQYSNVAFDSATATYSYQLLKTPPAQAGSAAGA